MSTLQAGRDRRAAMILSSAMLPTPTVLLTGIMVMTGIPLLTGTMFPTAARATEERATESRDEVSAGQAGLDFEVSTLRGRVVWLAEAMARRHGVKSVPEAATSVLALETAGGELSPLVEDIRGRGFRRDERLRKVDLELLVRRYRGAPVVQVIRVFELTDQARFELDYWCDICAIAMYELKPCDCCQGEIELRRRRVGQDGRAAE